MRFGAVLLLGPTGAGKTPLGELMERRGAAGRRCHHFDFGRQLRGVAAGEAATGRLTSAETDVVREVLASGRLLEDREFGIAERLLAGFLEARTAVADDLVVLNGLPRHTGQARALERLVDVRWVLCMSCSPETVRRRIASNSGGDRAGRRDDDSDAVSRRLELFRERTAPLVEYYRAAGAAVGQWAVGPQSCAEEALGAVEDLLRC